MSTVDSGSTTATLVERYSLKALVESCLVLEEGVAAIKDIDIGMRAGAGILPGPFARADEAGLDTMLEALERAASEWGERFEPPLILRRLVAQGRLGKKPGQGFFPYPRPDEGQLRETVLLETRADGGTQRLPRLVGEGKALEMNLTGTPIGSYEALRVGLASQVVPDHELFDTSLMWARKLAQQAPLAIERIKRVSAQGKLDKGLKLEAAAVGEAVWADDAKEGICAL